ncbi:hypothetical protein [Taibaiella soli]|uniref:Uncharacterized protein n=1 Tax=Taibaiella soli TaxID=1649169 RepID=A0A2W2AT08_9BACT|nr:hypothetical protein [Taibaiella soli]PZF70828.1 hypothetical protein DN068_21535 [Taibaiella soli]
MDRLHPDTEDKIYLLLGDPCFFRVGYEVDNSIRGLVIKRGVTGPYSQNAIISYYAVVERFKGKHQWQITITRIL